MKRSRKRKLKTRSRKRQESDKQIRHRRGRILSLKTRPSALKVLVKFLEFSIVALIVVIIAFGALSYVSNTSISYYYLYMTLSFFPCFAGLVAFWNCILRLTEEV